MLDDKDTFDWKAETTFNVQMTILKLITRTDKESNPAGHPNIGSIQSRSKIYAITDSHNHAYIYGGVLVV